MQWLPFQVFEEVSATDCSHLLSGRASGRERRARTEPQRQEISMSFLGSLAAALGAEARLGGWAISNNAETSASVSEGLSSDSSVAKRGNLSSRRSMRSMPSSLADTCTCLCNRYSTILSPVLDSAPVATDQFTVSVAASDFEQ